MAANIRAAGFVIFRRALKDIEYLLLQASYGTNHWSPPKGHVDPGESEYETALRETVEESGYQENQLLIIPEFKKILKYDVNGKPKTVTYWLAEVKLDDPVQLSSEHTNFKWLRIDEACKIAVFPDMQELLRACEEHLNSH